MTTDLQVQWKLKLCSFKEVHQLVSHNSIILQSHPNNERINNKWPQSNTCNLPVFILSPPINSKSWLSLAIGKFYKPT